MMLNRVGCYWKFISLELCDIKSILLIFKLRPKIYHLINILIMVLAKILLSINLHNQLLIIIIKYINIKYNLISTIRQIKS